MTRRRLIALGCAGLIVLAALLVGVIYLAVRGPFDLAQSRWDQKGSGDYTLVITSGFLIETRLTVQGGHVVKTEALPTPNRPVPPQGLPSGYVVSRLDELTVDGMLRMARQSQLNLWRSPWLVNYRIVYNPTYGYVSRFDYNPNGMLIKPDSPDYVYEGDFHYIAHDLVLTGSASP